MIALHYTLTTFQELLKQLADILGTQVKNQHLDIPKHSGTGFLKIIKINEGLEALVYNIKLYEELVLRRNKMASECYALTFDEVDQPSGASIRINAEVLEENTARNSAIYLTSSMSQVESVLHKNVTLGGVRILLTVPWMKEFLQLNTKEDVLSKYINLKTAGVWYMPVDTELKELLHYLITPQEDPRLFYQNKLLRIIEKFFNWLYNEMQSHNTSGISRHDIEAAQTVEGIITHDITAPPPTIKELAKEVAMSESKLKKIFKTVFGLPPYEYFQKQRMQKARIMLLSGEHSIKDVGYTLGYANLSNFTLAFKKEFKMLPSDLLKGLK